MSRYLQHGMTGSLLGIWFILGYKSYLVKNGYFQKPQIYKGLISPFTFHYFEVDRRRRGETKESENLKIIRLYYAARKLIKFGLKSEGQNIADIEFMGMQVDIPDMLEHKKEAREIYGLAAHEDALGDSDLLQLVNEFNMKSKEMPQCEALILRYIMRSKIGAKMLTKKGVKYTKELLAKNWPNILFDPNGIPIIIVRYRKIGHDEVDYTEIVKHDFRYLDIIIPLGPQRSQYLLSEREHPLFGKKAYKMKIGAEL